MVSENAAQAFGRTFGATGVWADPFLWAGMIALFAGLAGGQCLRAFVYIHESDSKARRRRPRRLARSICCLSLGLLALVGLLVLPDRSLKADGGLAPTLLFLAIAACAGFLSGLRPLAAGLPVLALASMAFFLFHLSLVGWIAYAPAGGGPIPIATILPYEVGGASFRGHLDISGRAGTQGREIELASSSCALRAECLRLSGALGLLAELDARLEPIPKSAQLGYPARYYRIVGAFSSGATGQEIARPPYLGLLDAVRPLPSGGPEPGAAAVSGEAMLSLFQRTRLTSPARPLYALSPVVFGLGFEGAEPKLTIESEMTFSQ
jgi:hypothetical protein